MARESTIQIYRTATGSSVPAGLTSGELAINMIDRRFFIGGTNGSNITFLDASAVVTGVNGTTGNVTNVAVTNATNNFTAVQAFPNGISGQSIKIASGATFSASYIDFNAATPTLYGYNTGGYLRMLANGTLFTVQAQPSIVLQDADTDLGGTPTITINPATLSGIGNVNIGGNTQTGINLQGNTVNSGKMSVVAGLSAQSLLVSAGSTFSGRASFTVGLTTQSLNVAQGATFNGRATFVVGLSAQSLYVDQGVTFNSTSTHVGIGTFNSGITTQSLSVSQGATFNSTATFVGNISAPNIVNQIVAGTNITITPTGGTGVVTINSSGGGSPVASTSITGVASFNINDFTVSTTGHVGLTGTVARTNAAQTFTGLQTFTNGLSAAAITGSTVFASGNIRSGGGAANSVLGAGTVTTDSLVADSLTPRNPGGGFSISDAFIGSSGIILDTPGAISIGDYSGVDTGNYMVFTSGSGTLSISGGVSADSYVLSSNGIIAKTTAYSLTGSDNGKIITFNAAGGITANIPAGLPVGFSVTMIQIGAGQVSITGPAGVTLNSYNNLVKIVGQHGSASVVSYQSNVYNLAGNLA